MKRFFFLATAAMLFSICAFAQNGRSLLKLRLSDNAIISVNLDGRFIDRQTTQLTLDGLRPGLHRLEVYADAGYRRRPVRIYTGTIRLAPATANLGVVDVYNRGLRLRTRPLDDRDIADDRYDDNHSRDDRPYNSGSSNNRNEYEYDDRRNNSSDDVYDNGRSSNSGTASSGNSGDGYGAFPHGRDNSAGNTGSGLSARDMDDLRSRVASRMTDSDKESLMKSVLQSRNASTAQIREMLGWLSFDSTRLEFAKWAYSHTTDPRNYWKLEDAFSFDSSKEEFSKSVSGR